MSKYIDADAFIEDCKQRSLTTAYQVYFELSRKSGIDIVRCSECKYWHKNIKGDDGIPIADMCYDFQTDDFCSYGERKEGK